MLAFGVPRLDDAFAEAAPGQATLISNEPGIDARSFAMQAAATALDAGRTVVYFNTDRSPGRVVRHLRERVGFGPEQLKILDAFSPLQGIPDPDHEPIDASDIGDVVHRIERMHDDHPDALFVLDSLNGLTQRTDAGGVAAAGDKLTRALSGFPEAVVTYTRWGDTDALDRFLNDFPNHLSLSAIQDRIITHHYFRIDRIAGLPGDGLPVMYRDDDGFVRVYVPKIAVTGPGDAGKTTFVHSICDHAVSADRMGATVALDKGVIDRDGMRVDVFGTPGQERFDALIEPLMSHAVGMVLVVDCGDRGSFPRAQEMLDRTWRRGIHCIIAANKQDLEGAAGAAELRAALDVPPGTEVLECEAKDKDSAMRVLDHLLDRILAVRPVTS